MSKTTVFGIKNCDTVKKALRWLDTQGILYSFSDFRKDGLSAQQIGQWLEHLPVETFINKRSTTWKQLSETQKQQIANGDITALVMENPTLIKRPLLETNNQVFVGFSEKSYAGIFNE